MDECRRLGLPAAEVPPISTPNGRPAARPAYAALDSAKFERDFGLRLTGWRVSVAATVERLA